MNVRIIPRLDIKGPNLVKGIHLEGLRVLGKPEEFARTYYEEGADELLYMDVVASLYQRNNLLDIVSKTAQKIPSKANCIMSMTGIVRVMEEARGRLYFNSANSLEKSAAWIGASNWSISQPIRVVGLWMPTATGQYCYRA